MSIMRVAVIGAGAAGLVALRHLTAKPDVFQAVAYEQTAKVGGTWVYTERVGTDENDLPIHSSMYKNMLTNLPKETMSFPDYPFPDNLQSYMKHDEVLKFLEDYATHFDLYKHIKFNTSVESVRLRKSSNGSDDKTLWEVGVKDARAAAPAAVDVQHFDAVMVCNGHYAIPLIPDLPGLDLFQGTVVHSHNYRHPEPFKDKAIVCLGAGASGLDITLDLAPHASKIYLCHRHPRLKSALPENVSQKEGIKEVTRTSVVLDNGEEIQTDVLLFCTGYRYNFEFLKDECKLEVEDERVDLLWKHLIHAKYPSLTVIGVPKVINPFPLFYCQVRFALASLTGSMALPSTEQMLKDIQQDFEGRLSRGLPPRHAHHFRDLQFDYNDILADMAGVPRIPKVVMNLYWHVHDNRSNHLMAYKQENFRLTGPETFEVL